MALVRMTMGVVFLSICIKSIKTAVEVVLTVLHAGGKFNKDNYKVSGGLHGVGVSCVNALSERIVVDIWRDGFHYTQAYSRGKPISDLKRLGETDNRGTRVHFYPDEDIFQETTVFSRDILARRLQELAFLNSGIKISFVDERDGWSADYEYEGGLRSYVLHLNQAKSAIHNEPIFVTGGEQGLEVEVALIGPLPMPKMWSVLSTTSTPLMVEPMSLV